MPSELTFTPMGKTVASRQGLERVADVDPRLTRSHYFDSRLLTAEDLNRDQLYLDGRLRELGQSLGDGILQGLELSLEPLDYRLSLTPGLAVTPAGRILELTSELSLNLGDRAVISELNQGRHRRLDRGLYAVILKYAEFGTDVAEVFPRDLGEKREAQYDVISEGTQLALVPLPQPLGEQDPLHIRANLMQAWEQDPLAGGALPEDAVALGVLAIADDRPQWLDSELLRRPLRRQPRPEDPQRGLARRYENLFADLMARRRTAALDGDFAASDYFRRLPPVGSLPREALDPESGRQGFFPEHFNVWMAPVRRSDLELIREESMALPPIDLDSRQPVDIMVLTPLDQADYGHYAQRLEGGAGVPLPVQDPLRLRLHPRPSHRLDTDAETWAAIWGRVEEADLLYVRRPLRTAETQLSGIALAHGVDLPPEPSDGGAGSPADNDLLEDEDSVFLNRLPLEQLRTWRPPVGAAGSEAADSLTTEFADSAQVVQHCAGALMRLERRYDDLVWQTLLTLAREERLEEFTDRLLEAQGDAETTGAALETMGPELGLSADLVSAWASHEAD